MVRQADAKPILPEHTGDANSPPGGFALYFREPFKSAPLGNPAAVPCRGVEGRVVCVTRLELALNRLATRCLCQIGLHEYYL